MQEFFDVSFNILGVKPRFWYVFSMFDDELEPRKKAAKAKNLEPMSVEELADYVESLKAEIVRVEAEMAKKKAYVTAASSFFKT